MFGKNMISWTENTNELYNEYINCWCWSDQISLPLGVSGSMIDNKKLKCHLFRWEIGTCWGTNINLGSVTDKLFPKKNSNQPVRFPVHCLEDSLRWSRLSTFFHCCFTRQKYSRLYSNTPEISRKWQHHLQQVASKSRNVASLSSTSASCLASSS